MPRRVHFVGRDDTNPKRPMLVYRAEGEEGTYSVPEEALKSPAGAEAAAAYVGGYGPDPGGPDTGETYMGQFGNSTEQQPVFANNYDQSARTVPGGAENLRARGANVYLGPPSPEQTQRYGTDAASGGGVQGVQGIAYDMQQRAQAASQLRQQLQQGTANPNVHPQTMSEAAFAEANAQASGGYEVDVGPSTVTPRPAEPAHAGALKRLRAQLGLGE